MKNLLLLFAILFFSLSVVAQKQTSKDVEAKRIEREDMRAILKVAIIFKKERNFPIMKIIVDSIKIDSSLVDLHDFSIVPFADTSFIIVVDKEQMNTVIDSFLKITKFSREDHETEKMFAVKVTKERRELLIKFFFAETLSLQEREIIHGVGLEIFYIKNVCKDVIDLEKKIVNKEAESLWRVRIEERNEELFDF